MWGWHLIPTIIPSLMCVMMRLTTSGVHLCCRRSWQLQSSWASEARGLDAGRPEARLGHGQQQGITRRRRMGRRPEVAGALQLSRGGMEQLGRSWEALRLSQGRRRWAGVMLRGMQLVSSKQEPACGWVECRS